MSQGSVAHESAAWHVSGEATYIDDIPEARGTVHAALGLSQQAHARVTQLDLAAVRSAAGVVAVYTAADIPGVNDCGPILHDDPVLANGLVQYIGQPLFLVVAQTRDQARQAATLAQVSYEPLTPVFSAATAHAAQQYVVPPLHLRRGEPDSILEQCEYRLQGQFQVGGQEQFYLEGQIAYVLPKEGNGYHVHTSTQHPTEMQHIICHVLNVKAHQVVVEMRRMGGGFGGKESQSGIFCALAALAAHHLRRPVKLRPDRDEDMLITGKRHGFDYHYDVGFDASGRVQALAIEMVCNAGFSADLTGPVATRALCHLDNSYWLPHVDIKVASARTNTQSNTAFRGFGGPQGAFAIEYIIETIAAQLQRDPLEIRQLNFYGKESNNVTPYQQTVRDNVIQELVQALVDSSDYASRREAINTYNAAQPILKKGLALTPVKFGISFNVKHFNQAGALVHVYTDGSVLVNHGGTEMGQGLNTKVAQIVAQTLGVPYAAVRATAADTSKVANTSATAASTGSDLNGAAAQAAAATIRARLLPIAAELLGCAAEAVIFSEGVVSGNGLTLPFAQVVQAAYEQRVQLWSDGFYKTPGLSWDRDTLTGNPFYYFAYGAAVAEVVIDTLTGEWRLLRADLLHDAGNSINPAIDIGQVEGAFIQGMGWLTLEELCWNEQGRLTTHAPSTYKIPAVSDCPPILNTELFDNPNVMDTVLRSKAVGEPPLLLGFSVFLAVRDAITRARGDGQAASLTAPATPEAILDALTRKPG